MSDAIVSGLQFYNKIRHNLPDKIKIENKEKYSRVIEIMKKSGEIHILILVNYTAQYIGSEHELFSAHELEMKRLINLYNEIVDEAMFYIRKLIHSESKIIFDQISELQIARDYLSRNPGNTNMERGATNARLYSINFEIQQLKKKEIASNIRLFEIIKIMG